MRKGYQLCGWELAQLMLENSLVVSIQSKHVSVLCPQNGTLEIFPSVYVCIKSINKNVHSSFIRNTPELETT